MTFDSSLRLATTMMLAGLLGTPAACAAKPPPAFATNGQCEGLPKLEVSAAPGFCVGLAAQGLGVPRGVLPLADGSVLVADMGNWNRGRGRLLRLVPEGAAYKATVLLTRLNRPHGLQLGADGLAYLGEDDRISRFDPKQAQPVLSPVVEGLPAGGEHPLKSFLVLQDGRLLVNIGSASNNCEDAKGQATCPEADGPAPRGALWIYTRQGERWVGKPYAKGLRNSVALAQDPATGRLWEADNARDAIKVAMGVAGSDEDLPHDTLHIVKEGAHYGWPYCHDKGLASPEFPAADCSRFEPPLQLLPAHAAPLGLVVYRNPQAGAAWRQVLLASYHGYRKTGHRIMGLALDDKGLPVAGAKWLPLALGKDGAAGKAPMGAPTDIKTDAAGHLWVSDDRSGSLMRISVLK